MSTAPRRSDLKKLPKKDRRAIAREMARIEREREAARRKRNRRLGWSGAGLAVVAAGVITVLALQASARAAHTGPNNMLSDGVVLTGDGSTITATRTSALGPGDDPTPTVVDRTSGVFDLVIYLDYRSPEAQSFWAANGESIDSWLTQGYVTLEIHPLALLDETSVAAEASATASATVSASADSTAASTPEATVDTTGDYSARAANALACVVNTVPDDALAVHEALIAAQPDLDEEGLSDDELVSLVQNAGVTDTTVTDCISDHGFTTWIQDATDRAVDSVGVSGSTPVVMVAGEQYTGDMGDADALLAFISEVNDKLTAEAEAEASASAEPTEESTEAATADPTDAATGQ